MNKTATITAHRRQHRMCEAPARKIRARHLRLRPRRAGQAAVSGSGSAIPAAGKPKTGKELLEVLIASGFVGMWEDRTDIGDSAEYARRLRARAWAGDTDH
jgi:hypothetical protein